MGERENSPSKEDKGDSTLSNSGASGTLDSGDGKDDATIEHRCRALLNQLGVEGMLRNLPKGTWSVEFKFGNRDVLRRDISCEESIQYAKRIVCDFWGLENDRTHLGVVDVDGETVLLHPTSTLEEHAMVLEATKLRKDNRSGVMPSKNAPYVDVTINVHVGIISTATKNATKLPSKIDDLRPTRSSSSGTTTTAKERVNARNSKSVFRIIRHFLFFRCYSAVS